MSPAFAAPSSTLRLVATSFAAGVGAIVLAALLVTFVADGGLSVTNAHAAELQREIPTVEPVDVAAIEARLDVAEVEMRAMQRATDDDVARLARLARR